MFRLADDADGSRCDRVAVDLEIDFVVSTAKVFAVGADGASRRGLTPRGSLECNPEIPAFPGEEN